MARFEVTMVSYTLKRAVDLTVIVPTPTYPDMINAEQNKQAVSHTQNDKFPVLYLLHGYSGNHSSWTSYANTEMYAEERKIAVVMISGENKAYIDSGKDDFYDFIEKELPDFVTGMFPISKRVEDTYIAGLSMGGYGTLIHALGNPDKYCAFGSFSGTTRSKTIPGEEVPTKYLPLKLIDQAHEKGTKLPKAYVACGGKDFLYDNNIELKNKLNEYGFDLTWVENSKYAHEWRFWNEQIEAFLDWIPRTDSYKDIRTGV